MLGFVPLHDKGTTKASKKDKETDFTKYFYKL